MSYENAIGRTYSPNRAASHVSTVPVKEKGKEKEYESKAHSTAKSQLMGNSGFVGTLSNEDDMGSPPLINRRLSHASTKENETESKAHSTAKNQLMNSGCQQQRNFSLVSTISLDIPAALDQQSPPSKGCWEDVANFTDILLEEDGAARLHEELMDVIKKAPDQISDFINNLYKVHLEEYYLTPRKLKIIIPPELLENQKFRQGIQKSSESFLRLLREYPDLPDAPKNENQEIQVRLGEVSFFSNYDGWVLFFDHSLSFLMHYECLDKKQKEIMILNVSSKKGWEEIIYPLTLRCDSEEFVSIHSGLSRSQQHDLLKWHILNILNGKDLEEMHRFFYKLLAITSPKIHKQAAVCLAEEEIFSKVLSIPSLIRTFYGPFSHDIRTNCFQRMVLRLSEKQRALLVNFFFTEEENIPQELLRIIADLLVTGEGTLIKSIENSPHGEKRLRILWLYLTRGYYKLNVHEVDIFEHLILKMFLRFLSPANGVNFRRELNDMKSLTVDTYYFLLSKEEKALFLEYHSDDIGSDGIFSTILEHLVSLRLQDRIESPQLKLILKEFTFMLRHVNKETRGIIYAKIFYDPLLKELF